MEKFLRAAKAAGMPRDQVENLLSAGYLPQPKQILFHAACRECDTGPVEVGFGGARGPGKSHALVAQIALDDCHRVDGLKALLLRKVGKAVRESFEDLRAKVLKYVQHEYNRSSGTVTFPNGSKIILGHFHNEGDIDQWLGLEYDVIGVEEATTLTEGKYKAIRTTNRSSSGFRPRIYSTTNPGGVGHAWYKARFVTPYRMGKETTTRFIPATVYDNAFVNPEYVETLRDLKGWMRQAWLEGSWDIAAGMYFTNLEPSIHFVDPFPIPAYWPYRWIGLDYGWTHPTAAVFMAMDNEGRVYVVDEYAVSKLPVEAHAENLQSMIGRLGWNDLYTVAAGGDMWLPGKDGTTVAEDYEKYFPLERANMNRIDGAATLLRRLDNRTLFIFNTCHRLIETLGALQSDPHRPEDVLKVDADDTGQGGDDLYDALRYGIMVPEEFKKMDLRYSVLNYE